ncbi:hypothetical protein [Corynebacterium sp. HMSC074A01]|uniref:hypothetical protein n=1 Tax=Corynebacterium sp. HMSC074A01 TaxID=1715030 RepID=UPI0008A46033|nr:hypothetical protein [Corynebacterium sp. HMSC074A01]OHF36046.1 hypothetical protein HMPREF2550_10070 [Corynebacterium sp. HMSC074A01]
MINREDFTSARLPFYDADYTRLRDALQSVPVGRANPAQDTSGIAELIRREGRPTLIRRTQLILITVIFPIALVLIGNAALSAFDTRFLAFSMVFVCMALLFYAAAGFMAYRGIREIRRRNRVQEAWNNGWLRLYPVLVGDLIKHGRAYSKGDEDLHVYNYSALCLLLNPNGEWMPLPEQKFTFGYDTEVPARGPREKDFLVVESAEAARVDPEHNNGWALYMVPYGKSIDQGALTVDLSGAQERAVFAQMAKRWNLPFDSADAKWW